MRHSDPLKIHPGRITKQDKELINVLDYERIEFPVSKKGFNKSLVKKQNLHQFFLLL